MLLGLVLGYLYAGASDPADAVPALDPRFGLSSLQALQGARIDGALLEHEALTSLRVFGSLPVTPEAGGKSDPFQ
jgi:hypothetical protein